MTKPIPAIVTPEILAWARNLDKITIDAVSHSLHVPMEKVIAWEKGSELPTLQQAKKLSKIFRVPFVYFYLPDTPKKTKRLDKVDYRTFGNSGIDTEYSREMRWLLRDIEDRRDVMKELYEVAGRQPTPFPMSAEVTSNDVANRIRQLLNLSKDIQFHFRNSNQALSYYTAELEKRDVLVFQAAKISPLEMRGLSVGYSTFPIIVLNRKDEASARVFTLCHELAHIITGSSGICNNVSENSTTTNRAEIFCNSVAGQALVPKELLHLHPALQKISSSGFDDSLIRIIARDFAVSREVIIRRLLDIKIINRNTYQSALDRYTQEYLQSKKKAKKDGFLPPALDKGTQVGKLYARTVLSSLSNDSITPRDASGYLLNLGVQHFSKVERWCY